jgi:CubicO group peptidase (beta-lactamase class C family)
VVVKVAYTGDYKGNEELIRLLREHAPAPTARAYVYGNIGYNTAALAMDAVTGTTWKRTLRDLIFVPLRMTRTTAYASEVDTIVMAQPYRATPAGFERRRRGKVDATMQSAGGLFSTPDDMGRWLLAHINDGRIATQQLIPAAAIRESHKRLAVVHAPESSLRVTAYGLGWQIGLLGDETIFMHGGGFPGYATSVVHRAQNWQSAARGFHRLSARPTGSSARRAHR